MSDRADVPEEGDEATRRLDPEALSARRPPVPPSTTPPSTTSPSPAAPAGSTRAGRRRRTEDAADSDAATRARAAAGLPAQDESDPGHDVDPPAPDEVPDHARDTGDDAGRRAPSGPRSRRATTFGRAAGLTVLGAVVPGTALLAAGRRRMGASVLVVFVLLLAGLLWLATAGRRAALRSAVDPGVLLGVMVGVGVLALLWVAVVVLGYQLLLPRRTTRLQRGLGAGLVLLLAAAVVAPAVIVVQLANAQRGLVDSVFADGRSATVEDPADPVNPFGDKERVNILLLGGDGGAGRQGVRTDTVIVASIQTATGATTLFSLPRNLENVPFPPGSRLAELFPDGFDVGNEGDSLLTSIYRNGPAMYPDALGTPSDDPGADWLKLGVGQVLGLPIDYYLLVNLDGFSRLVDALGGVTVNVNYYVPVGGEPSIGILPDSYIAPGPNQKMDGATALAYARGRFGLSDYQRMDRQRCLLDAIVTAADPVTLLTRYQQLARTTSDIVSTDVPQSVLGEFVDLAFLVKDAGIRSVVFDDTVITPAYPDYDQIRALVQQALGKAPAPSAPPSSSSAPTTTPPTSAAPAPVDDVRNACAYDPAAAQAALEEGQPPTRSG